MQSSSRIGAPCHVDAATEGSSNDQPPSSSARAVRPLVASLAHASIAANTDPGVSSRRSSFSGPASRVWAPTVAAKQFASSVDSSTRNSSAHAACHTRPSEVRLVGSLHALPASTPDAVMAQTAPHLEFFTLLLLVRGLVAGGEEATGYQPHPLHRRCCVLRPGQLGRVMVMETGQHGACDAEREVDPSEMGILDA